MFKYFKRNIKKLFFNNRYSWTYMYREHLSIASEERLRFEKYNSTSHEGKRAISQI